MEQSSYSKIQSALMIAYPYYFKDMQKEESIAFMQLYYNKLKGYDYEIVAKTIDNIITNNKFMPTIAEIIEKCDKEKRNYYKKKIDALYKIGYFKTDEEYGKALTWLFEEKPIIPQWLLNEINKVNLIEGRGK